MDVRNIWRCKCNMYFKIWLICLHGSSSSQIICWVIVVWNYWARDMTLVPMLNISENVFFLNFLLLCVSFDSLAWALIFAQQLVIGVTPTAGCILSPNWWWKKSSISTAIQTELTGRRQHWSNMYKAYLKTDWERWTPFLSICVV